MFGFLEMLTRRFDEQTREFLKAQENVRQRAASGLLDPFQVLQPVRASVQGAAACDLPLPKPAQERRQSATRSPGKRRLPRAPKRPALHFA
jgi:hypothetical protein